ncbi:MAG: acyl-CoA desaturase [Deltaproteobacteria bacterium HGW-Deltaproteobacteria-14]|jgi:stearoyl-CoA desaturase (delta-9 desaturase)|nr:MAG: acyl-CoA desaturase [Deltaproteobacteria bacterium HGW-Deltaproteobacteria-14]
MNQRTDPRNLPPKRLENPDLERHNGISATLPFALAHVACVAAIWTGVTTDALIVGAVLYVVRMFGATAGYHRYFSHRTFETSRVGAFLLGWLAQTGAQKGVLWWAAHHRVHHQRSDQEGDVHSPVVHGFWHGHVGWIFDPALTPTRWSRVRDLSRYPELRFLNRFWILPPLSLALTVLAIWGWSGLVVGFVWSTVALWHGIFTINSLAHLWGSRTFDTPDHSRNNPLLALITLGEGWHNNHHHHMLSTRQGFRWWQFDITYYVLKVMSWFRLVWDLREPPDELKRAQPKP